MTEAKRHSEPDASSQEFRITFRDDAIPEADRQNAESSVAALVARSAAAIAQECAAEADLAALTASANGPIVKLLEEDSVADKALEALRTHQFAHRGAMESLREDRRPTLTERTLPLAPEAGVGLRTLGFVPPYDFTWSWHDTNGHAPFNQLGPMLDGSVGLDARSGAVPGGASGFVNAHAGVGIFLSSDTEGKRFPHSVLDPGRYSFREATVGIGANATSEGGFELTVFEDGHFLTGASRLLWHRRVSEGDDASGGQEAQVFTGPELEFTLRAGHGYTFNAGIWVTSDRTTGIGAAAVQSLLQGTVARMWVFG
ncbi:hypothetical protein [Streptomyces sp. NPDC046805]|uniref:hypothetical protein n=1 Tax=Streptomyces sp. NPDC046805 TaxID=3155134 RepID=UPI0033DD8122